MAVWNLTINLKQYFDEEDPTSPEQVIEVARKVTKRLKQFADSKLVQLKAERDDIYLPELQDIIEEFELMDPDVEPSVQHASADELQDEFNRILDDLYDWADSNRVWIGGQKGTIRW